MLDQSQDRRDGSVSVKGFYRVGINNADGTLVGMTDWIPNVVTLAGFRDFIVGSVGSSVSAATARVVSHMAFGTHGTPASTETALSSEVSRIAVGNSYLSAAGGATMQATALWTTGAGETHAGIGAVALHGTSSGGSAACIATFASSSKASDQTLTITYQLRFASA